MAIYKCKMCGGALEIAEGSTTCECDYCGSLQTLPRLDDDRRANLYDRANHFRRANEFDKAAGIYETILNEDGTDAEAYWSLVLCRYGIEYVEDPATKKRIPTVNRAQFTSVFDDDNYKQALSRADLFQKSIYEREAAEINEIQKGILAISQKEEPFDVFICYKETDNNGRRTPDSVLANDLYHQLTQEGLKVFFSRITLEDKLGSAYEPYIFAALNSARVMVVLGTKPEHFSAVWVKNEWSRYLAIVKGSKGQKALIPAYRDMDPYDLPEEFSHLQAQDMSKLGFMQDLVRGIRKVLSADSPQEKKQQITRQAAGGDNANISNLYRRAQLFLEDGDFNSANEYADKILDEDAEFAPAYMVQVLAAYRARSEEELQECRADANLPKDPRMKKAIRFAEDGSACKHIALRVAENAAFIGIMETLGIKLAPQNGAEGNAAHAKKKLASRIKAEGTGDAADSAYKFAAESLKGLTTYALAEDCADLCLQLAEIMPLYNAYMQYCRALKDAADWKQFKKVAADFEELGTFRDSPAKAQQGLQSAVADVQQKLNEGIAWINRAEDDAAADLALASLQELKGEISLAEAKAQHKKKKEELAKARAKKKRTVIILSAAAALIAAALAIYVFVIKPAMDYNAAGALRAAGEYEAAIEAYTALGEYKDSAAQISGCKEDIKEREYKAAGALREAGEYDAAYAKYSMLQGYKDVDSLLSTDENLIAAAAKRAEWSTIGNIVKLGHYEQDNNTGNGKEEIEWVVLGVDEANDRVLLISRYALDCKPYNKEYVDTTWEKCTLRSWLNNDFKNAAFTKEELAKIPTVTVPAHKNPSYSTNPGNDTQDKIFLLSITEVNQYFKNDDAMKAAPTAYAKAQGAYTSDSYKTATGEATCWWWLRSPGRNGSFAAYVDRDGGVYGDGVDYSNDAVRPALWVNLAS